MTHVEIRSVQPHPRGPRLLAADIPVRAEDQLPVSMLTVDSNQSTDHHHSRLGVIGRSSSHIRLVWNILPLDILVTS